MSKNARCTLLYVTILAVALLAPAACGDWPQFLGPTRDGISTETGLARTWPEAGPRTLWSIPVGEGFAGASIRDGEVFLLDREKNTKDILRCFALDSGEEKWRFEYDAPGDASMAGSRTPPTVDENVVFSVGMLGHFYCVDRKTHQPVWQKNILTDFGVGKPIWGVSQSPLLYKNLVIVAPQAGKAFVVAYERATGKVVWQSQGLGNVGYVTPTLATLDGVEQVVMASSGKRDGVPAGPVAGISVADGSVLWSYDNWQCGIPIAFPTPLPGNRVFITGGYNAGSAMIEVKKGASGFDVKEIFKLDGKTCGSQIHQPILYKDYLYLNSNSNERESGMTCMGLDGSVKWRTSDTEGLPKFERGNFILADNMFIALDGKTGILYLVSPSPEKYNELAHAKILDGSKLWAPLALSEGKLVLRSQTTMKCLDLKNPA